MRNLMVRSCNCMAQNIQLTAQEKAVIEKLNDPDAR